MQTGISINDVAEEAGVKCQQLLDSLPYRVGLLDAAGVVIATNRAWELAAGGAGDGVQAAPLGSNYLARVEAAASELALRLRGVLAGEEPGFEAEYADHSGHSPRWFTVRAGVIPGNGHARIVVVHSDETARKLAEAAVEGEARRSEVLFRVARALVQVTTLVQVAHVLRTQATGHLGATDVALIVARSETRGAVWSADAGGSMRAHPEGMDLRQLPTPDFRAAVVVVHPDDPGWSPGLEPGGHCRLCAMFREAQFIGYLRLGWGAGIPEGVVPDEALLRALGDMAGMAVARAQMHEELSRRGEELRMLAARTAEVSEAEHRRVAADLHDQAGQHFAALSFGLQLLMDRMPEPQRRAETATLERLQQALQALGGCIRGVMAELWPLSVEGDVLDSIRGYALDFERRSGIRVVVEGVGGVRLGTRVETALLRIVQEALTNVARHSRARQATIRFGAEGNRWTLEISDAGCGFEVGEPVTSDGRVHLGLVAMRERALAIEATLEVESRPGAGTRLRLTGHVKWPGDQA